MFHVYLLIDPRNDRVFYVGCSKNLKQRLSNHASDVGSSASLYMRWLKRASVKPRVEIVASFEDRHEAFDFEYKTLDSYPDTLNTMRRGWVPNIGYARIDDQFLDRHYKLWNSERGQAGASS